MKFLKRDIILWIQFLWYPMLVVTGEHVGTDLESDPRIFISTDRRIQIKRTAEPCSSSYDDDYIGEYAIDPCTGRVSNRNYWSSSSRVFSACPATAPAFSLSTPPTKSPVYSSKQTSMNPTVATAPSFFTYAPTQVPDLNSNAPSRVIFPSLVPKSPSTQTSSRSSLKPSLNSPTHVPTRRLVPTIILTPSVRYKTQLPTKLLDRPTLVGSSTKAPIMLGPTIVLTPSVRYKTLMPTKTLDRPTLIGSSTNAPTISSRLRPTVTTLSLKPTFPSYDNNTIVSPIGNKPQTRQDSNKTLALGLGLAAFVGLALLASRALWKRKIALGRSNKMDEDEDDVALSEPDKGTHVGDCHCTADGLKWFDPSCLLCQDTLLRRKAEEESLAQRRKMSIDVHSCASATCDKCHRPEENEVIFISTRSGERNTKKDVTSVEKRTMPYCSYIEDDDAKRN